MLFLGHGRSSPLSSEKFHESGTVGKLFRRTCTYDSRISSAIGPLVMEFIYVATKLNQQNKAERETSLMPRERNGIFTKQY